MAHIPTQDYKDYDVVLLIGIGIGAIPLISIAKDILSNLKAFDDDVDALFDWSSSGHRNFKTRKAYFHWATREEGSFDLFKVVMNEVAGMDRKGVIEMHNCSTSVYGEGYDQSALNAMLQTMNQAKNGVDIGLGSRVKSHFGKPNWRKVYTTTALAHPGSRVGELLNLGPIITF